MFAVPGWNLSATLKTESEAPPVASAAAAGSNPKKRKRQNKKGGDGNNAAGRNVTSENVADMWAEVVEGTKRSQPNETGSQKMKSQKQEYTAAQKLEMQAKQQQQKQEEDIGDKEKKPKSKKQRRDEDASAAPKAKEGQKAEKKDDGTPATAKEHDTSKQEAKGKKQKKDKKDKKRDNNAQDTSDNDSKSNPAAAAAAAPSPLPPANAKLTPLQAKMREKLASARFRHLNQTLYTTPSAHSLQLIEEDPQIFNEYHAGFRQQVAVWPENPVDTFVQLVKRRGEVRGARKKPEKKRPDGEEGSDDECDDDKRQLKPLPRDFRSHVCTIADLGCGDAKLSASLQPSLRKLKLAIHSFDLAAPSPLITKADISNLPLADGSVDIAIFCLALMGTNWPDFIDEAYRVLRWKGELWVAEIKSRFGRVASSSSNKEKKVVDHSVGRRQKKGAAANSKQNKQDAAAAAAEDEQDLAVTVDGAPSARAETDVSAFVNALRARGFVLDAPAGAENSAIDLRNRMFVHMRFVKAAAPTRGKNVRRDEGKGGGRGGGAGGGGTWKAKAKKTAFVDEDDEGAVDEAGLLKPCVYKLR
ncbi:methyltransferase-domain-containing protein [Phyllosticta paracitricarpa]|uniref:Ribosomal RNA-processing protein 8 n=1 Tax=Phyllosticta paracitricarpa TaxID=2016321 RepID=A0ABR1MZK8_9PEZI